jgi:hypothetical protein
VGRAAALVGLCVCLAAAAGWQAWRELSAFLDLGASGPAQVLALSSAQVQPAASSYSDSLLLNVCSEVMHSILGRAQPATTRAELLGACNSLAARMTAGAPTFSQAWYVQADASAELGHVDVLNDAMVRSCRTAPNLHWLASLRVKLAEAYFDQLGGPARQCELDDMRALLGSAAGAQFLASLYAPETGFRDRLKGVLEGASGAEQQRYLSVLAAQSDAPGG